MWRRRNLTLLLAWQKKKNVVAEYAAKKRRNVVDMDD